MSGPLGGIRVIEFAGLGPGPFCGMMLADHGAEVIRVDRIGAKGLLQDPRDDFTNRSRRTIGVDLKRDEGLLLVRQLCRSADAVLEGYRPGVMERLGLGPNVLLADKPNLVYGRMTGFGQTGPYAKMAGHDINYIALSGVLHSSGRAGHPPTPPLNLVADFGGGGMMLAFGLLAGILSARATGKGQVIDCAMSDGSALLMAMIYSFRAGGLWRDARGANILDSGAPFYDAYETADGKHIALGAIEPQFYRELIERIGLAGDPVMQAQGPVDAWPAQKAKVAAAIRTRSREEWCALLEGTDVCFAPVLSLDEAPHHPHNVARGTFVDVAGTLQPGPSPRFSETSAAAPTPLESSAEVTASILGGIGLSGADIERLQRAGVVS